VANRWEVHVRIRDGGPATIGAAYHNRDEAQNELEAISKGQKEHTHIDLPWLSVHGDDVLSASVIENIHAEGLRLEE